MKQKPKQTQRKINLLFDLENEKLWNYKCFYISPFLGWSGVRIYIYRKQFTMQNTNTNTHKTKKKIIKQTMIEWRETKVKTWLCIGGISLDFFN